MIENEVDLETQLMALWGKISLHERIINILVEPTLYESMDLS